MGMDAELVEHGANKLWKGAKLFFVAAVLLAFSVGAAIVGLAWYLT